MKKGFTLIELLAVIVILAIIALIATPIVLNIIKDSKESATVRSSELYLKATENAIANKLLKDPTFKIEDGTYSIMNDGNICLGTYSDNECTGDIVKVESNNQRPDGGFITIKDGQIVSHSIAFGDKIIKSDDYVEYKGESIENAELTDGAYIHGDYKYIAVYPENIVTDYSEFGGATTLEDARKYFKEMIVQQMGVTWEEALEQANVTEEEVWISVGLVPNTVIGWKVEVIDKTKTEYSPILGSINGAPVTDLSNTFKNCTNLKVAPQIPSSVTNLDGTFYGCTSLTDTITLMCSLTGFRHTWKNCSVPVIYIHVSNCGHSGEVLPEGATYQTGWYSHSCNEAFDVGAFKKKYVAGDPVPTTLKKGDMYTYNGYQYSYGIALVGDMEDEYYYDNYGRVHWPHMGTCYTWITNPESADAIDGWAVNYIGDDTKPAPVLSYILGEPVVNMDYTFYDDPLTIAPKIPNTVTSMKGTFFRCTSLTTAPVIHSNVTNMTDTFAGCQSLTGTITINANPTNYQGCFRTLNYSDFDPENTTFWTFKVDFTAQKLKLSGSSTMLDKLGATGLNYQS